MPAIKFAIADDHKIFRQGLRFALSNDKGIDCIGEADNGRKLLELLEQQQPDVALIDLKMPEMDGIDTTKEIRRLYPDMKIIILTMFDDEHFIVHLMENGANGYLIKNAEPDEIKTAIRSAHETGYYFNDLVSNTMLKSLMQKQKASPRFKPEIKLNDRELEVLRLICAEHTAAEIGEKVFLSARTVEGIRANLLEKIGVRNTAGLVMYAVKNGIVE
ncbi:response regulator transcription factor [Polluticoccus soli]|uniref:response regulator transcription factor n=1 Tax=Polluticoccus soli TaxID=3034150 RepID=UPI0023E0D9DB|nr:response regulator transcription factor [Flavipsychrobacter sp. JY13-12]